MNSATSKLTSVSELKSKSGIYASYAPGQTKITSTATVSNISKLNTASKALIKPNSLYGGAYNTT